jgi:thymidylate synthase
MKEYLVKCKTLPEAYHQALVALLYMGDISQCPDYNTTQIELSMTISVMEPLSEPRISRLFIGGAKDLEQYVQEICDGILDFEIERGNWAYTYHSRMADQLDFIEHELKRNPSSRRAVIDIRDWKHDTAEGNENPACLQHIQYFIRDGALDCIVLFRSNDACKAAFMNAFALIMLQKRMADRLGVPVGTYSHRANSFHCYERDFQLLSGYVKRIESGEKTTYDYEGDWEELMEEARPEIARSVDKLRNNLEIS